jgi:hypothetical protein
MKIETKAAAVELRDLDKAQPEAKHMRLSTKVRAGLAAAHTTCSPCADDCGGSSMF